MIKINVKSTNPRVKPITRFPIPTVPKTTLPKPKYPIIERPVKDPLPKPKYPIISNPIKETPYRNNKKH